MTHFVFTVNYGKLQTPGKFEVTMKKTLLLLIMLLLLASCQSEEETPHKLKIEENMTSYVYTINDEDTEYTLNVPFLNTTDEELASVVGPIYSLNPKVENKDARNLYMSTFYKNDDVDTYTKDTVYKYALYGYGFWVLNDSGMNKAANNSLLNKNDYSVLFGDFYNNNDFNNLDYINYYLATQELIWETINDPESGGTYQIEFKDIDVSFEKTKILDTQKDYDRAPFFGGSVLNVSDERLAENEPFELTDSNGILSRFDIVASDGIDILKSDNPNVLSFNIRNITRNSKIDFISPFKIKQEISQVYSSNDNVSYLSIGQYRSTVLSNSLYLEKENLSDGITLAIRTYDEDSKIEIYGAQYHVSTGPEFLEPSTTTVSTDEFPALLENLVPGTYYVQQIVAPEGYALNQEVEEISIKSGIIEMIYPFYNIKK